jgi:hypothetical protein
MLYIDNRLIRPVIFLEIFVASYGATIIDLPRSLLFVLMPLLFLLKVLISFLP